MTPKQRLCLLFTLYVLQGVPLGLALGGLPYLVKSLRPDLSYQAFGIMSLASFPYTIKLLWSPLVDAFYSKRLGRRLTWIIPLQAMQGLLFFCFGRGIDAYLMGKTFEPSHFALGMAICVVLAATQDIAVDAWSLEILSESPKHNGMAESEDMMHGSTETQVLNSRTPSSSGNKHCMKRHFGAIQSVGLNCGYLLSYTAFLALTSQSFCVRYLGMIHGALISIGGYLMFWGVVLMVMSVFLLIWSSIMSTNSKMDRARENIAAVSHEATESISLVNREVTENMALVSHEATDDSRDNSPLVSHGTTENMALVSHQATANMTLVSNRQLVSNRPSASFTPVEFNCSTRHQLLKAYRSLLGLMLADGMNWLIPFLLAYKIGFVAKDTLFGLKLLDIGYSPEDMALLALIGFPFSIVFGLLAGRLSAKAAADLHGHASLSRENSEYGQHSSLSGHSSGSLHGYSELSEQRMMTDASLNVKIVGPLKPMLLAIKLKMLLTIIASIFLYWHSHQPFSPPVSLQNDHPDSKVMISKQQRWLPALLIIQLGNSFASELLYGCQAQLFGMLVREHSLAGSHITRLNTFASLGGMLPRMPLFMLVDMVSTNECIISKKSDILDGQHILHLSSSACRRNSSSQHGMNACVRAGGQCRVKRDGYYVIAAGMLVLGVLTYAWLLVPLGKRISSGLVESVKMSDGMMGRCDDLGEGSYVKEQSIDMNQLQMDESTIVQDERQ